ncbi:hypothetical protein GIB67_007221 [Kingdonia uniflora]|uniref:Uncharacterized protein n=1 Tax=Kingdonia uniflora TaxID=39325 RepID=A0A7J7NXA4_9MAGN|nr:hypothetical protein GIB67_007221 [Kingdonia uniflora]
MLHKRPSVDEESYGIPYKHQRQLDHKDQLASIDDFVHHKDGNQKPSSGVEYQGGIIETQGEHRFARDNVAEILGGIDKKFETRALESLARSNVELGVHAHDLPTCSEEEVETHTSEDDFMFKAEVGSFFSPATLLNILPRKLVSLGPDHQADVPLWGTGIGNPTQMVDDEMEKKLMGICILPMPDVEAYIFNDNKVGNSRTECSCVDEGSIRCVRQHILEARKKLKETLGEESFMELGFCDMGEEVVRKWTGEEEQVFHEVILSHPASSGRNFWQQLSVALPSRTKYNFVSYYFNVFMLRRRAEQNRSISMSIDSDNDMIESSDDEGEECETSEEEDQEESSVMESQIDEDDSVHGVYCHQERIHKDNNWLLHDCSLNTELDHMRGPCKNIGDGDGDGGDGDDNEIQDDSCTSYECQTVRVSAKDCQVETDKHVYDMGSCDIDKVWDVPYLTGLKFDFDLLPTSNMMKEVFGEDDKGTN